MQDMVNISFGTGGMVALLGYAVVFTGLILLMIVVMIMSRIMIARTKKAAPAAAPAASAPAVSTPAEKAAGTAGELKLYDTDPKDAAMVMAIIADTLGKPLNELRFISIKEVKDDEI